MLKGYPGQKPTSKIYDKTYLKKINIINKTANRKE